MGASTGAAAGGAGEAGGAAADGGRGIRDGDRVVLVEVETGFRYLVELDGRGARKEKGLGVFDPGRLAGQPFGQAVQVGAKLVVPVRPALEDLTATLRRKAQIIMAKDASRILFELGVGAGDRVLESGIGSGAATVALAWAVGPSGRVVVQELRPDFAEWAAGNLERAGLADRVQMHIGDLTQGLAAGVQGPFHAVLLDQPEPWKAVPHLPLHLAPGARFAAYCPQVGQMEETVRALWAGGWGAVRAMELIERHWEVKERGSRPSFDGLGHTGFLVFARWLGQPVPRPSPET